MTTQPYTASAAQPAWASHCSWLATIVTACATVFLASLAYMQFGEVGAWAVVAFGLANIASICLSSLLAAAVAARHPNLSGLASASGIRMIAPLVVALMIVAARGQLGPVETVYYIIPLFLCSLAADVASHVRELQAAAGAGKTVNPPQAESDEVR